MRENLVNNDRFPVEFLKIIFSGSGAIFFLNFRLFSVICFFKVYLTVRVLKNFYFFILFLKIPYAFPTICALIIIRKMEPFPAP